jgi:four helix bundle protein
MSVKTFHDLIAWQKAMDAAEATYQITMAMPKSERFGLTFQMHRAAVSIPSNIAEGFGRQSRSDLLRFLRVARGSLMELQTQLELSERLRFLKRPDSLLELLAETDRVLQALIRSLEEKEESETKGRKKETERRRDEETK